MPREESHLFAVWIWLFNSYFSPGKRIINLWCKFHWGAWTAFHGHWWWRECRNSFHAPCTDGCRWGGLECSVRQLWGTKSFLCASVDVLHDQNYTSKLTDFRALSSLRVQVPSSASPWSMSRRNSGTYHRNRDVAAPGRSHTWRMGASGVCHRLHTDTE